MAQPSALTFSAHRPPHRERLLGRAAAREWREILDRPAALEDLRRSVRTPPEAPSQMSKAGAWLTGRNEERTVDLIRRGVRDEDRLLDALGDGRTALAGEDRFPLLFLGLVATLDCSLLPRCVYCNQIGLPRRLALSDLKRLVDEASDPVPPYVYVTGGEPLLLAAEIWGDHGIVAHATARGAPVNINTNAALITPCVALQLVKIGTAKLHISFDSPEDPVPDGLLDVQIAREALGADHPRIHVNAVLTSRNLSLVPDLLDLVLGMRREGTAGDDFAIHLIPVGGSENAILRPAADEWKRFYTEVWDRAEEVFSRRQEEAGVPAGDREALTDAYPFISPWHRVRHALDLDEYCREAARGRYWQGALGRRCYVCPTQAWVLPDGAQHWCGAHAIRRPPPLGNVMEATLRENIRRNAPALADLPIEACSSCAGATCAINQAAERILRDRVADLLQSCAAPG